MIFYILAVLNMGVQLLFLVPLIYYRNNPMIANRDWPLIVFVSTFVSIICFLNAVGYELYFAGDPNWGNTCKYLLLWPTILSCSFGTTPTLCRAYNLQSKYYLHQEKAKMSEGSFYYRYSYLATLKYNVIFLVGFFVLSIIPAIIVYLLLPIPENPANVTQCLGVFPYYSIIQGVPISVLLNFLLIRYWTLRDPYKIKVEFGWQFTTGFTLFATWMILQLYDTITGGVNFPSNFHPLYFLSLFCFNTTICNVVYPVYLAYQESRLDLGIVDDNGTNSFFTGPRKVMKKTNSAEVTVKEVLENEVLCAAFKETTIQYWCVETFLFIIAVETYRKLGDIEREKEGKKMFHMFLEPDSQLFVNVSGQEAKFIAGHVNQRNFPSSLFDGCYKDVLGQLEGILMRWKTTEEYKHIFAHSNFNSTTKPHRDSTATSDSNMARTSSSAKRLSKSMTHSQSQSQIHSESVLQLDDLATESKN